MQKPCVLDKPSKNETEIVNIIRDWLKSINIDVSVEWVTESGKIDLYLKNRRIIIEVKKPDRLVNGPEHKGTGGNASESPLQQVEKYIKAERQRERLYLEDENIEDWPWIGIVTNSRKWWMWEWPPAGKGDIRTPRDAWQGTTLTQQIRHAYVPFYTIIKLKRLGPPDDPTACLLYKELFKNVHEREEPSIRDGKVWLRQLRVLIVH